jgi:hypothetical protein
MAMGSQGESSDRTLGVEVPLDEGPVEPSESRIMGDMVVVLMSSMGRTVELVFMN